MLVGREKVDKFDWNALKGKEILGFRPGLDAAAVLRSGAAPERHRSRQGREARQQRRHPGARRLLARRPEPVRDLHRAGRLPARARRQGAISSPRSARPSASPTTQPSWRPTSTSTTIRRSSRAGRTRSTKAMQWTAAAPAAEVAKVLEPFFPGVNPQALVAAAAALSAAEDLEEHRRSSSRRRSRSSRISWCRATCSMPTSASISGPGAHRVRQQGEVSRAGASSRPRGAEGRAARRQPALFRPRGRDRGAARTSRSRSRAGEFVAIIGQSGCGKSTLLSLISGILAADRRRGAGRRSQPSPGRAARSATCCSRIICSSGGRSSRTRCSAPRSRAPTWPRRARARRSS